MLSRFSSVALARSTSSTVSVFRASVWQNRSVRLLTTSAVEQYSAPSTQWNRQLNLQQTTFSAPRPHLEEAYLFSQNSNRADDAEADDTETDGADGNQQQGGDNNGKPNSKDAADAPLLTSAPYLAELPLVPLSRSRPGFPGSSFRWTWPSHEETQRILLNQQKEQQPYFGMFLMKTELEQAEEKKAAELNPSSSTTAEDPALVQVFSQYHKTGVIAEFRIDGEPALGKGTVAVQCLRRVAITSVVQTTPFLKVAVEHVDDPSLATLSLQEKDVVEAHMKELQLALTTSMEHADVQGRARLQYTPRVNLQSPGALADYCATLSTATAVQLQGVLNNRSLSDRLYQALVMLKQDQKMSDLQQDILKRVDENFTAAHKKAKLREQKKVIDEMLGNGAKNNKEALLTKFQSRLEGKELSAEVRKTIDSELEKLQSIEGDSSEFNLTRNYLDWLTQVPWNVMSPEKFDISHAETVLDAGHSGMYDVKQRILEFIAVGRLLGGVPQGKILCLVGPPGVGKTSIGRSIANALGREFYRFSVGGLDDTAEIKGHRRTYVGSMPGKLIQAIKTTQTANPVILIDEIDKLGKGARGDPAAALLEALDPEQNSTFIDHYLDVPCDLSKVLFVCTANDSSLIPGPLADRMDFINLSGYVWKEKISIAQQYLEPNIRKATGVNKEQVNLDLSAVGSLIRWYCREPGVRRLQQHMEKIFRKAALKVARQTEPETIDITENNLAEYVGKRVYTSDRMYETLPTGVALGLAYTSYGGATVFIESTLADKKQKVVAASSATSSDKKKGKETAALEQWTSGHAGAAGFFCTGQLGDVMKESTHIAYTVAKRYLPLISPQHSSFFASSYIHLHIPAGGTPKDGPSAGITMTVSLLSLALETPMSQDLAMTGELTLTGRVCAIGGVKEKVLAAKRANVTHIIFPEENRHDWEDLQDYVREGLTAHFVSSFDQVVQLAFPHVSMQALQSVSQSVSSSPNSIISRLPSSSISPSPSPSSEIVTPFPTPIDTPAVERVHAASSGSSQSTSKSTRSTRSRRS